MASDLTYYPFEGKPCRFWSSQPFGAWERLIDSLAEGAMPMGWQYDERAPFDRDFQDERDRYALVEMFDADENSIEVVTLDGKPIGVLDRADIGEAELAQFKTYEQWEAAE
jgi:hypothetical protein